MRVKHTPGPWRVSGASLDGFTPIMARGGTIVALISTLSGTALEDATLIAAAPMLFEAAIDTAKALNLLRLGLADDPKAVEVIDAHLVLLQTAIARATGAS